jgi:hypothetical protein
MTAPQIDDATEDLTVQESMLINQQLQRLQIERQQIADALKESNERDHIAEAAQQPYDGNTDLTVQELMLSQEAKNRAYKESQEIAFELEKMNDRDRLAEVAEQEHQRMVRINKLHTLIIEIALVYPSITLQQIKAELLLAQRISEKPDDYHRNIYALRNINYYEIIKGYGISPRDIDLSFSDERAYLREIEQASKLRLEAKQSNDKNAELARVYHRLINHPFNFAEAEAFNIIEEHNLDGLDFTKVTDDQIEILKHIIHQLVENSLPIDCTTFSKAAEFNISLEEALNEIKRIMAGKTQTLQTEIDIKRLITSNNLTEFHLNFISSYHLDRVRFTLRYLAANSNTPSTLHTYRIYQQPEKILAKMDKAMSLMMESGFNCFDSKIGVLQLAAEDKLDTYINTITIKDAPVFPKGDIDRHYIIKDIVIQIALEHSSVTPEQIQKELTTAANAAINYDGDFTPAYPLENINYYYKIKNHIITHFKIDMVFADSAQLLRDIETARLMRRVELYKIYNNPSKATLYHKLLAYPFNHPIDDAIRLVNSKSIEALSAVTKKQMIGLQEIVTELMRNSLSNCTDLHPEELFHWRHADAALQEVTRIVTGQPGTLITDKFNHVERIHQNHLTLLHIELFSKFSLDRLRRELKIHEYAISFKEQYVNIWMRKASLQQAMDIMGGQGMGCIESRNKVRSLVLNDELDSFITRTLPNAAPPLNNVSTGFLNSLSNTTLAAVAFVITVGVGAAVYYTRSSFWRRKSERAVDLKDDPESQQLLGNKKQHTP